MKIFVDTSAFVALEDRSDARHGAARSFFEALRPPDRLYTSNYVVDETVTRLRYTVGHAAAVAFADAILASRLFALIYVDAELESAAVAVLKKYRDQKLSFTDCTSLAVIAGRRMDAVFAFDQDFVAAGCRVVP